MEPELPLILNYGPSSRGLGVIRKAQRSHSESTVTETMRVDAITMEKNSEGEKASGLSSGNLHYLTGS